MGFESALNYLRDAGNVERVWRCLAEPLLSHNIEIMKHYFLTAFFIMSTPERAFAQVITDAETALILTGKHS